MEQASGRGAATGSAVADTAFSSPVAIVDFSEVVAPLDLK